MNELTAKFKKLVNNARDSGLLNHELESQCVDAIRQNDMDAMDELRDKIETVIKFHELTQNEGIISKAIEKLKENVLQLQSESGFAVLSLIVTIIVLSIIAAIFQPSFLTAARIKAMENFAVEVNDIIEGVKRFHWSNNRFPNDNTELLNFMKLSSWPVNPFGNFSYSSGTGAATLTITSSSTDTDKYLNIIDRQTPFSACSGSTCTITIPEMAVYIRQEIKNALIVTPGAAVSKPSCAAGMSPHILVTPVGTSDSLGAGLSSFRAYPDDNGASWTVHLCATSIAGGTYVTNGALTSLSTPPSEVCDDARIGRVHVLTFCH